MNSKLAFGVALGIASVGAGAQASDAQTYSRTPVNQDTASAPAPRVDTQESRQTGWYLGPTIGNLAIEDLNDDYANIGFLGARLGYAPIRQLAFEAEAAFGVIPQTYDFGATEVDVNLDSAFGVFVVGRIPVSESFLLFGRVGGATAKLKADGGGVTVTGDQTEGWGAGIGAEWATSGPTFRADVTGYDFDGEGAGQASLSILMRF